MATGRLGRLLKTRSGAEVSGDAGLIRPKAVLRPDFKVEGKISRGILRAYTE
jgi:hypothetical protein